MSCKRTKSHQRINSLRERLKNSNALGHLEFDFFFNKHPYEHRITGVARMPWGDDLEVIADAEGGDISVEIQKFRFSLQKIEEIDRSECKQAHDLKVGDAFIVNRTLREVQYPVRFNELRKFNISNGERTDIEIQHYIEINWFRVLCSSDFKCEEVSVGTNMYFMNDSPFYFGPTAKSGVNFLLGKTHEFNTEQWKQWADF